MPARKSPKSQDPVTESIAAPLDAPAAETVAVPADAPAAPARKRTRKTAVDAGKVEAPAAPVTASTPADAPEDAPAPAKRKPRKATSKAVSAEVPVEAPVEAQVEAPTETPLEASPPEPAVESAAAVETSRAPIKKGRWKVGKAQAEQPAVATGSAPGETSPATAKESVHEAPGEAAAAPAGEAAPEAPEEDVDTTLRPVALEELPERLKAAAMSAGWKTLMPVQAQAIPHLLDGKDMIVQARTGSGKTGAFLLPMLERLDPDLPKCQALILVPTRELARQVEQDAQTLCSGAGFRSAVVYGGVGYREQLDALKEGAQIVIGTPGRVLDLLIKRAFSLEQIRILVYDEADRMLSMGFYPDMKRMQRHLANREFQSCMFSATFPSYVLRTAREFIPNPEFLTLTSGKVHVTDIDHRFYEVEGMDKDRGLVRLIEIENPAAAIIFCNTKARVHYITVVLQRFGYDADELSADLSQKDRERVLERVRKGTLRFLVATDVAARGLDVPELSHVFQYEPPEDPEAYIHRAGRTGRAGASGIAITLVNIIEKMALQRIASRFGVNIQEHKLPTDADVAEVVAERLTAVLEARLRERDKLVTERSARFVPLARSLAENEDESALIAMLLDEYYQTTLHAPVVPPAPPQPHPQSQGERPPGSGGGGRRRRR